MGFDLAKHGLNKTWIREIGLSFLRDQTIEREGGGKERRRGRGRGRGREEEEEEKKKRRRGEAKIKKVWNYMEFLKF